MFFIHTCRWSLWSVRTAARKWSRQSRTWADNKGRHHHITSAHFQREKSCKAQRHNWVNPPTEPPLKAGVTASSLQCTAELLMRTFVWSEKTGKEHLGNVKGRYSLSWKISRSLTCTSLSAALGETIESEEQRKNTQRLVELLWIISQRTEENAVTSDGQTDGLAKQVTGMEVVFFLILRCQNKLIWSPGQQVTGSQWENRATAQIKRSLETVQFVCRPGENIA